MYYNSINPTKAVVQAHYTSVFVYEEHVEQTTF